MMDYVIFHQALLASLVDTKDGFEKANQLDVENGGEDFPYEAVYQTVFDYIVTGKKSEGLTMCVFSENLLESAYEKKLPTEESLIGERDFAKKMFLVIMAKSIMSNMLNG